MKIMQHLALAAVALACGGRDAVSSPPDPSGPSVVQRAGEAPPWVAIPPATAWIGAPDGELCADDDEPRSEVTLAHTFEIAATEVPRADFVARLASDPAFARDCADCPIESVTWYEAASYCNALSRAAGLAACYRCSGGGGDLRCAASDEEDGASCLGYRLPSAVEWEVAARAGGATAFPGGAPTSCMTTDQSLANYGWYKVNSEGRTHAVGTKRPNTWGLYDMHGNVYEWTADATADGRRVVKGGAFYYNAEHARSANRESFRPARA